MAICLGDFGTHWEPLENRLLICLGSGGRSNRGSYWIVNIFNTAKELQNMFWINMAIANMLNCAKHFKTSMFMCAAAPKLLPGSNPHPRAGSSNPIQSGKLFWSILVQWNFSFLIWGTKTQHFHDFWIFEHQGTLIYWFYYIPKYNNEYKSCMDIFLKNSIFANLRI